LRFFSHANLDFIQSIELFCLFHQQLGCGHGLPSIFALLNGAEAHLQDYVTGSFDILEVVLLTLSIQKNEEVIAQLTIPNVTLNASNSIPDLAKRCHFFCGDWSSLDVQYEFLQLF
jgi:hypothetical protein